MTNGTAHEVIDGVVAARNDRGVRIGEEWFNLSQFGPKLELPEAGAHVRLKVDAKGYIRDLDVLSDQDEPVEIVLPEPTAIRLQVLQAAAAFSARREEIKSADVLRIAESWIKWVEEQS
jgi:CHAD domain-containing protein